jgi:hypothetical protein
MMTIFDLIVIYLACGAPFGVYFFLHFRKRSFSRQLWLKTILTFLFWIPFAYRLLVNGKIKRKLFQLRFDARTISDSEQESESSLLKHKIERVFLDAKFPLSIYEVREVFDRYAGLTSACQNPGKPVSEQAAELFRIAKSENVNLGAICLERRNQKRLGFHQSQAREDFLKLLEQLIAKIARPLELEKLSVQFVKTLNDVEAISRVEKMFAAALQTDKNLSVKELEKDLWKSEIQRPQPARQISISMHSMRARTNSLTKD